jgi:CPA2 family monovalent cation:H+ antiporter-2
VDGHFPILLGSGLILVLLFFIGFIGLKIRVPGVILYILLGIVVGGILTDHELLHIAGEIGIVLLFFMLGMEFPLKRLGGIAKKVAPAGFFDVALNLGVVMGICYIFGLDLITSLIIAGIVYATSSSITAKLLESSKRMANTESEFILALLIFEDLVAPIVVAILVGLTSGSGITGMDFLLLLTKIILLTLGAIFIGRYLFTRLGTFFDRYMNHDIFILLVVGMALTYGGLALYLNLSEVLGAFLAGMILAEVRRTENLEHMLLPVKDLMLPLFFLYFGTTITFGEGVPMLYLLIFLLVWSIVAKIAVGFYGGRWYGLSKRVALRAGLSLTQRGEFSVIIASLAVGWIKVFGGIFILFSALCGILLFQLAPKITNLVYGKRKTNKKVKLPG